MWIVRLSKPLPGIRSEVFEFWTDAEAHEFASCLHAFFPDQGLTTRVEQTGSATEVFPEWSF